MDSEEDIMKEIEEIIKPKRNNKFYNEEENVYDICDKMLESLD